FVADRIREVVHDRTMSDEPWDIIFLGHSRGAVLNDQVIRRLGLDDRVDYIDEIMLDPTSSHLTGDLYPTSVPYAAQHEVMYDDGHSLNPPAADAVEAICKAAGEQIGEALGRKIAKDFGAAIGKDIGG